tara:strand:- start:897 stop:1406 length:510 start_codon:yes stop_codon:yes gene_type:complete
MIAEVRASTSLGRQYIRIARQIISAFHPKCGRWQQLSQRFKSESPMIEQAFKSSPTANDPFSGRMFFRYAGLQRRLKLLAVYLIVTIIAGLTMDWALIERFKMNFRAFGDSDEIRYADLPRWRLMAIVIASTAVGWSLSIHEPLLFWAGVALFGAAVAHGVYTALRRRS